MISLHLLGLHDLLLALLAAFQPCHVVVVVVVVCKTFALELCCARNSLAFALYGGCALLALLLGFLFGVELQPIVMSGGLACINRARWLVIRIVGCVCRL